MASTPMQSPLGPRILIAGQERDYFAGTGYLGLHNHPDVVQAALNTIQLYGMATATSRGGYGESPVYDELEQEARAFFEAESILYYATAYLSTTVLAQGLRQHYDRIFIDSWSHFSVFDGAHIPERPVETFEHNNPSALAETLQRSLRAGERPIVLSDGVFPISGEIAPVPDYLKIIEPYNGLICLDDAHAGGAIGPHGRGTLDFHGIRSERCIAAYTLSKAFGGYGGLVAGSSELTNELDSNSRVYTAASPTPLPIAAASAAALRVARTHPELREKLWANVFRIRSGLRAIGWDLPDLPVPIICLRAQSGLDLAYIKESLFERNICISHVKNYSSTPPGGALRIAVFATHSFEQIDHLLYEMRLLI